MNSSAYIIEHMYVKVFKFLMLNNKPCASFPVTNVWCSVFSTCSSERLQWMLGVGCPVAWQLTLIAFAVSREITATSSVIIGFPGERLDVYYLAVGGLTDPG